MKHIFLLTAFLSSLVGCNASVLDFEARQVDVLSGDQAVAKTNPLDNSTQPGQVSGEAHNYTKHLEYLKQRTHTLIRKSTSNDGCKDDFSDKQHAQLWNRFRTALEAFSEDHARAFIAATYISSSFVRACVRLECSGCPNLEVLRGIAYKAWTYSIYNKCNANEVQASDYKRCRCNLKYNWGGVCPKEGTY
ncbi:hypothetical protein DSO57_1027514 [Entomophthora muscae]|uniref:Uncharacterized protein n=1 Tax=Entomophthora muscae TaxID=34485 RepID=A0ACC2UNC2_9FUNG|nr:hypothetical protein DSO57_1027514 [Entomophthora muscae]